MRKGFLINLLSLATSGLIGTVAVANPPKVDKQDGHVIPLLAEITLSDGKTLPDGIMVYGILSGNKIEYAKHYWRLTGEGGTAVRVWLDTIAEVKGIDDKNLTVVFKNGQERRFGHGGEWLMVHHPSDTKEEVPVVKVQSVRFLKAPRKDKSGQANFDQWQFSPYTGEKLPRAQDGP